ncbi:unnamed protein product, partial [Rotaria socialis]
MSSEHGLHVMLSYHWDNKELVSKIYKVLRSRNLPVWMDIHGGIGFNLFQSMADGVENAAVVCCFMTPKYQNSRNCEKELLYAERRRVSIIPCRLTRDWEPSTWLGLITAGLVWVDFREAIDMNIDLKIDRLIDQIRIVTGKKFNCFLQGLIEISKINALNNLYPMLPQTAEKSDHATLTDSTSIVSRQHRTVSNVNMKPTPPPVPPRPNKNLIRERLVDLELIDDKKENNLPLSSRKPDICEIPAQHQADTYICEIPAQHQADTCSIPDILPLSPSKINNEKKRTGIAIDYSKFDRSPRIIGDDNDEISFCCPSGVAISKTGLIYIADQQNQCVKVIPLLRSDKPILSRPFNRPKVILDHELNLLKSIGNHGSKPGEFNVPWGVATDWSSNIYVCDQMNNRIQKFDTDGQFLLEWGYEGEHVGQFYYPHFISISGNRVAVSDQLNHRVQ